MYARLSLSVPEFLSDVDLSICTALGLDVVPRPLNQVWAFTLGPFRRLSWWLVATETYWQNAPRYKDTSSVLLLMLVKHRLRAPLPTETTLRLYE